MMSFFIAVREVKRISIESLLVDIIRKGDLYQETGSESIRQELCTLEALIDHKFIDQGSPEIYRGCINFIHKYLKRVVM